MFTVWVQVTSWVNHFDPHSGDESVAKGGEITLFIAIVLMLGTIYNAPGCMAAWLGVEPCESCLFVCSVSGGFMIGNRIFIALLCVSTYCSLSSVDKLAAQYWLRIVGMHPVSSAVIWGIMLALRYSRWCFIVGSVIDMGVIFVPMVLKSASMLPCDLQMWVARTEALVKGALVGVLVAAEQAGFCKFLILQV